MTKRKMKPMMPNQRRRNIWVQWVNMPKNKMIKWPITMKMTNGKAQMKLIPNWKIMEDSAIHSVEMDTILLRSKLCHKFLMEKFLLKKLVETHWHKKSWTRLKVLEFMIKMSLLTFWNQLKVLKFSWTRPQKNNWLEMEPLFIHTFYLSHYYLKFI